MHDQFCSKLLFAIKNKHNKVINENKIRCVKKSEKVGKTFIVLMYKSKTSLKLLQKYIKTIVLFMTEKKKCEYK